MSSSFGRIALGVVGAVIGAPFGLSAVGFSIGSAIGGALFAPEGPTQEGPRLGDTDVTASSLGKIIPEHYGVTRTSGNIIWSGGLKEVRTQRTQNKSKTITYTYSVSFATVLGRGPAEEVRKIWADGKLIYDGTSGSETDNTKYTWRLLKGGDNSPVDPLIAESINRRLAGLPDINAGNQPQAVYTTINDLILKAQETPTGRGALYATGLAQLRADAELGLADGEVPDYAFTPAYRGLAMIIFDDISLDDFGNRIPNITAEVVWSGASAGNGLEGQEPVRPTGATFAEIAGTAIPDGIMASSSGTNKVFASSGNTIRRLNRAEIREDRQKEISEFGVPISQWTEKVFNPDAGENGRLVISPAPAELGYVIERMLTALPSGAAMALGTRSIGPDQSTPVETMVIISESGLEPIGIRGDAVFANAEYATMVNIEGQYPAWAINTGDNGDVGGTITERQLNGDPGGSFSNTVGTDGDAGDHFAVVSGNTLSIARVVGGSLTNTTEITMSSTFPGGTVTTNAPLSSAPARDSGIADILATKFSPSAIWVGVYRVENFAISRGFVTGSALAAPLVDSAFTANPFTASITHVSGTIFNSGTEEVIVVVGLSNGATGIIQYSETLEVGYTVEIPGVTPPLADSGLTRSDIRNNTLAFAHGMDIVEVNTVDGTYTIHTDVLEEPASNKAQGYYADVAGLLLWEGSTPMLYRVGTVAGNSRDHDIAALLPDVISRICERAGMSPTEYDVSGVSNIPVRGYSIARAATGRQSLENLLQAYFVDGVESDLAVRFRDRTTTSIRTIEEDELGEVSSPTGPVNWLESRVPEYDLPSEINVNFSDPLRDYQTSTAHKRRISNPVPAMYSDSVQSLELPLVMKEFEAQDTAEKLLYLTWLSRDAAKSTLNWKHADLDPGDVITVRFKDGRTVTDRIAKATLGANFEIEMESIRSGDPVFVSAPQTIIPTGSIPSVNSPVPVDSEIFVFDIPLLFDYHETGRSAARYYTAVGTEADNWSSATIFNSPDGITYAAGDTVSLDVTWGNVLGTLQPPRAPWTTDNDNSLRVAIVQDNGDLSTVTFDAILNGQNRALVYNRQTGLGEIIQFQNVAIEDNGATYVFSGLTRGLRGTEYASNLHTPDEHFVLLKESEIQVGTSDLSLLGTTGYFKAVSSGQIINSVAPRVRRFVGRSLMPYAPSRVTREEVGGDLVINWTRRTRVGGSWDMVNSIETVPLSEDFEQYELYLLPQTVDAIDAFSPGDEGSFLRKVVVDTPAHTFTAADLTSLGVSLDEPINLCVYQVSAQVGRGFPALGTLAP